MSAQNTHTATHSHTAMSKSANAQGHKAGHAGHADHGDHHGHDHDHNDGAPHSTLSGYMIGFALSVVLTAIPFWLVIAKVIADRNTAVLVLGGFAVAQIVVHMVFFLHMNGKVEGGWTLLSTIFTLVFVAIAITGTLWVMFHMNANMMPDHPGMPGAMQHGSGVGAAHDSTP